MIQFAEDLVESGSLLHTPHNIEFLSEFAQDASIRVMRSMARKPPHCPECENVLTGFCGRLICYGCTLTFFRETEDTRKQCPDCISFRDARDEEQYKKMIHQGFGEGCTGCYNRGKQMQLYRELKTLGLTPEVWRVASQKKMQLRLKIILEPT